MILVNLVLMVGKNIFISLPYTVDDIFLDDSYPFYLVPLVRGEKKGEKKKKEEENQATNSTLRNKKKKKEFWIVKVFIEAGLEERIAIVFVHKDFIMVSGLSGHPMLLQMIIIIVMITIIILIIVSKPV